MVEGYPWASFWSNNTVKEKGEVSVRRKGTILTMRTISILTLMFTVGDAVACQVCRPTVYAKVFDSEFLPMLGLLLVPLIIVLAIGLLVYSIASGK